MSTTIGSANIRLCHRYNTKKEKEKKKNLFVVRTHRSYSQNSFPMLTFARTEKGCSLCTGAL